jgi:hypothetical protein
VQDTVSRIMENAEMN